MRTTIDSGGRIVIPRAIREQVRLKAGASVDVRLRDGIIEIEPTPQAVELVRRGHLVVAVPRESPPPLRQGDVDATLRGLREDRMDADR